jgi:Recombinase/Recombinase zinc beta ribbon domain
LVFSKFAELGSIRQVAIWLCDEGIKMPVISYGPRGRMVDWQLPRYNTIHRPLTNPVYAGAYVFGRTRSQVRVESGRKRITHNVRRRQEEWEVLIRDQHESYISWSDYEKNQRTISGNANMKGEMVRGSVRNGGGLLAGLLRCGHCGRKLKVQHNGLYSVARYRCGDARANHGRRRKCIAFGNMRIDTAVSAEVLSVIAPLGLEAALQVVADRERDGTPQLRRIELALEQARYEAARAHRQYDVVDPENRLVAADLERRWNERLAEVARLEEQVRVIHESLPAAMTETERADICQSLFST